MAAKSPELWRPKKQKAGLGLLPSLAEISPRLTPLPPLILPPDKLSHPPPPNTRKCKNLKITYLCTCLLLLNQVQNVGDEALLCKNLCQRTIGSDENSPWFNCRQYHVRSLKMHDVRVVLKQAWNLRRPYRKAYNVKQEKLWHWQTPLQRRDKFCNLAFVCLLPELHSVSLIVYAVAIQNFTRVLKPNVCICHKDWKLKHIFLPGVLSFSHVCSFPGRPGLSRTNSLLLSSQFSWNSSQLYPSLLFFPLSLWSVKPDNDHPMSCHGHLGWSMSEVVSGCYQDGQSKRLTLHSGYRQFFSWKPRPAEPYPPHAAHGSATVGGWSHWLQVETVRLLPFLNCLT